MGVDVPGKDMVVIGGSSGGIDPIRRFLSALPRDFPGSLFVVVHTSADAPGILNVIFGGGPLPAVVAGNGERIVPGRIYVPPPDHHLLLEPGRIRLTRGPKENRFRPAIDPLFRSAAQVYGPRVVGVIVSGGLDDGSSGLWAVKRLGGIAVVQDPREALAPSMPLSAIRHVPVDHVVGADEIAPILVRLAATPADVPEEVTVPEPVRIEVDIAREHNPKEAGMMRLGEASNFACPECHGVLMEMKEAIPPRYRCHTGHAYTLESLLAEMDEAIEGSLWNAIRALEERVMLIRHAAVHLQQHEGEADDLLLRAEETQRRADLVRQAALNDDDADAGASRG